MQLYNFYNSCSILVSPGQAKIQRMSKNIQPYNHMQSYTTIYKCLISLLLNLLSNLLSPPHTHTHTHTKQTSSTHTRGAPDTSDIYIFYTHTHTHTKHASSTQTGGSSDTSDVSIFCTPVFSPKKAPAFERFHSLVEPAQPSLPLPYKFKVLAEMFHCTDTVLNLLGQRKATCTFVKLKNAVQEMSRK